MNLENMIAINNKDLTIFFFVIVLLLVSAHGFGYLFHKMRLPKVIGEIAGGLVLGPTFLGNFSPDLYSKIFNAFEFEGRLISAIYWLGLVLLMFVSGFEIQRSFD
jgi:Kef-type K+ transport system membrane component KefB